MDKKRTWWQAAVSVLAAVVLFMGGRFYISSVQDALLRLSVNDLKEITVQAGHAFEVYLRKDYQTLHGLALGLSQKNSDDIDYIESRLHSYNDNSNSSYYSIMDMDQRVLYSTLSKNLKNPLSESLLDIYGDVSGSGVEEPYLSSIDGTRTLTSYECFTFADGVNGIVRRARPLSLVAEEFSLSIYDGEGFSYIVNREGDILIRSSQNNSNHTFKNVFEIMDLQGENSQGNQEVVDAFRAAMAEGKGGVMRFSAVDGQKYIYAYVPVSGTDSWYFISVVPNDVLVEQSAHVMNISLLFLLVVAAGILIGIIIAVLVRKNRKALERINQEVRYREQLFDILTNSTEDVFVMYTARDQRVEYVSPNVEQALGIPAAEARRDITVLRETEEGGAAFARKLAGLKPGESFSTELERVHRQTNEHRWFRMTVYRVMIEEVEKVIMVLSDRTLEKQKEQTLEDAMKIAETANHAKSTFLNNMSHDIRTPMNAIVGLCTLLKRDSANQDKVQDYTQKITASSQHLLGLINDVLDMSKIESGKTTLTISEINLAEIVDGLNTILRPQAKAKQQTFEISVFDVKSEHLMGDLLRINQILINILSNAIKYTPAGGKIEMIVRELPQTVRSFARLRFTIRDNGIGMSPEYLETIFQPFTREVNSGTNKIQGTGLGMTITKSLLELMGGTIAVESTPGLGSTFTVELELRIQERDVNQEFWAECGVTNVLVVDDEAEVCASIIGAMEGTGVRMQSAPDGSSAVQAVERALETGEAFDLILLDWEMPGMSGQETARRLRGILPEATPILALSSCDWGDIDEEVLAAGADGFMPKPFFFSNFKLAVERMQNQEESDGQEDTGILKGLHILAAEDNELNAEILQELLDMLGADSEIAENGQQAFQRFAGSEEGEYDLILMDVQMPEMNGYEATRAIRACSHPQAGTIPIIAMTADAFAEDIQKALEAGMNVHVSKPIDLNRLEEAVQEAMKA